MPEGVAIGVLLGALVIGLAIRTLIGAVCLRAAVALYQAVALLNKMAGGASSPSSVPQPAFGKAMWIIFSTTVAQMIAGLLIGRLADVEPLAPGAGKQGVDVVALLVYVSISFLIMVGILSERLPTTFGRAILVTLCYILVELLVVGVLVVIAIIVLGAVLR